MREIRNVVCQNVFPSASLRLHGWLPPLRNALSGMECGEESQVGESARRLSGRCSLRFLLAHPKKGSPNDEAVSQEVTKREIDGKPDCFSNFRPSSLPTAVIEGCPQRSGKQGSEQGSLLATPLPYHSLRLVPWVWYGIKDSTNERTVSCDTWWKCWGKPFLIEMTTEIHGIANQKETKW